MDENKKELEKEKEEELKEEVNKNDDSSEQDEDLKPKAPLGERIDDAMDDIVGGLYDFIYGERKNFTEDIPATMPDPDNEIRHINKVQTRRNFNRRYGKVIVKIFLGFVLFAIIISVITFIIGLFFN